MRWLETLVDEIISRHTGDGEVLVESGASPSGTYHIGHLREILICDAIVLEIQSRGRQARHIHFVDDLDALRKIPVNVSKDFEKYLGKPLCDIPSPSGNEGSYADYFLNGFISSAESLGVDMELVKSHEKYREGFFIPAIEKALSNVSGAKRILESVSGRKLDDTWSGIQVMEDGYLKTRELKSLNIEDKTISYRDNEGNAQTISYIDGQVKLDWRLDWPGRWWLMNVDVEPFGRDHASSGGSYDTGAELVKELYGTNPPLPVPYDFINLAGDTKKMSASKGTGIAAEEAVKILPPEVLKYFILLPAPSKRLYFDSIDGVVKLVDEYAELVAKADKSPEEKKILLITQGNLRSKPVVSGVPFSLLANSYQASLKNLEHTINLVAKTEYADLVKKDEEIIKRELVFIDAWLEHWAPEDVKFELSQKVEKKEFSEDEKKYFTQLAEKIKNAPNDADGEWFHKAIYAFKESDNLDSSILFGALYRLLIGKTSGPRAGWFLSILPRDWLIKRLQLNS